MSHRILTLNAGSSSIKFAVDRIDATIAIEERLARGALERIGLSQGVFRGEDSRGRVERSLTLSSHDEALNALIQWLAQSPAGKPTAIGHRIVQGGPRFNRPTLLESRVLEELKTLVSLAPNHLPGEIDAIEAARRAFSGVPQVLCFDTAFHRGMPEIAQRLPLARGLYDRGVVRCGFHGLSYEYVVAELLRVAGPTAGGRAVIAHLGNGASLAAVRDGQPVDTTMGLTPLGGLVMGTRTGDLDPGTVLFLMREQRLSVDQAEELLSKRSGLLAISGTTSDMKDLLDREASDSRAAQTVEIFCRQARKHIAAMAASLGGLDTLVFTGGIGERSARIRERIGCGLAFLGASIDKPKNERDEEVISVGSAAATVRVIRTNEELMIARHTARLCG